MYQKEINLHLSQIILNGTVDKNKVLSFLGYHIFILQHKVYYKSSVI